jgi:hypothetical protein
MIKKCAHSAYEYFVTMTPLRAMHVLRRWLILNALNIPLVPVVLTTAELSSFCHQNRQGYQATLMVPTTHISSCVGAPTFNMIIIMLWSYLPCLPQLLIPGTCIDNSGRGKQGVDLVSTKITAELG